MQREAPFDAVYPDGSPTQMDGASHVALVVKNPSANAGEARDLGSIPGLGRFPGGGHGNPLQYSCLENSMDRGAWQATIHRVTQSRTQVKRLSMHAHTLIIKKCNYILSPVKLWV